MNVFERFREAWSVFRGRDHPGNITQFTPGYGTSTITYHGAMGSGTRPDRYRMSAGNEKTLVASAYTRIALDVAAVEMHHAKIDDRNLFHAVHFEIFAVVFRHVRISGLSLVMSI